MRHVSVKIFGRVQGVFFRDSAKREADRLDIKGFARNEPNGSVYIEAEGRDENIDEFLAWCQKGPQLSKIEKTTVKEDAAKNFKDFKTY